MLDQLQVGDQAPEFELPISGLGQSVFRLMEYKGKIVVLFFYPKNFTPGCTQEACDFRDLSSLEGSMETEVVFLGISADSIDSHRLFRRIHKLPFPLASDTSCEVAKQYGAWGHQEIDGEAVQSIIRTTIIIGSNQNVLAAYYDVQVKDHARNVSLFLQRCGFWQEQRTQ